MLAGTRQRVTAPLVMCTLLLATGGGACSYAFVDGPPTTHRQLSYFTCTSSNILPTIDAVVGGLYAVSAIGIGASGSDFRQDSKIASVIVSAGVAALLGTSAYSGYSKTSECREATSELQARMARLQLQSSMGFGAGPPGAAPSLLPPARDPWLSPPTGIFGKPPADEPAPAAPSNSSPDNDVPKKKR
jgi:hypothetical protein